MRPYLPLSRPAPTYVPQAVPLPALPEWNARIAETRRG
jgi:hypothetical protein